MADSVRPLRSQPDSFERALEAYRAAELRACIFHLHGVYGSAAAALRSRAFLRLGNPTRGLEAATYDVAPDDVYAAELAVLQGTAHQQLGNLVHMEAALQAAHGIAAAFGDTVIEAEVLLVRARAAFEARAYAENRAICARAIDRLTGLAEDESSARARTRIYRAEHLLRSLLTYKGFSDAAEGRYHEQIPHARQALAIIERAPIKDVFGEANSIQTMAVLARDFDLPEVDLIRDRILHLPWTTDISRPRVISAETIAWNYALHGDTVESLRLLRLAEAAVTIIPERVMIGVFRSVLASEGGLRSFADEEIEHVLQLGDQYAWEEAEGHYRYALLHLAQAAARIDPVRARLALERYRRLQSKLDFLYLSQHEERIPAEEFYTEGLVRRGEGRIADSVEPLTRAFAIWERIGFEWRAGRAALELAEVDAGEAFRHAVKREIHLRPASFYAKRARRIA